MKNFIIKFVFFASLSLIRMTKRRMKKVRARSEHGVYYLYMLNSSSKIML